MPDNIHSSAAPEDGAESGAIPDAGTAQSDPTRSSAGEDAPAAPGRRRPPRPKKKQPGPYRVPPRERRHGLLIVNTGHGKGKTTAALGVLLRATGRDMRVGMFQFIKSAANPYGEHVAAARLGLEIVPLADGFISTVVALAAVRAEPSAAHALFFAHRSTEHWHGAALAALDARPLLSLNMRLGEGSGTALAIPILRAAAAVLREMATFDGAGVSRRDPAADEGAA